MKMMLNVPQLRLLRKPQDAGKDKAFTKTALQARSATAAVVKDHGLDNLITQRFLLTLYIRMRGEEGSE